MYLFIYLYSANKATKIMSIMHLLYLVFVLSMLFYAIKSRYQAFQSSLSSGTKFEMEGITIAYSFTSN